MGQMAGQPYNGRMPSVNAERHARVKHEQYPNGIQKRGSKQKRLAHILSTIIRFTLNKEKLFFPQGAPVYNTERHKCVDMKKVIFRQAVFFKCKLGRISKLIFIKLKCGKKTITFL